MARNGVGVYNLPSGQPVVTGTTISSTTFNALTTDLANALTTSIASDGQTAMTANLPMGGFKATGLGAATVAGDAVRFEQTGALALTQGAAASGANADITSITGPVSTVNGQTLLHLNDIVNGNFVIAQAGTSFAAAAAGAYDLDGWLNGTVGGAVFTVAQVAGSTAGRLARQITITTAKATAAAGDYVADITRIEGYNIEKYVGNTFTVGFRAKVPVAGIHCVSLRNGPDRSYVVEINFPTANVYQNCSFTVVGGFPVSGTWNYVNGVGLELWFSHLCGATLQTTPNAWQTGNFIATANQVNDCATVGNVWAMEKVTLNLGTVAAVSEISYEDELRRCQRQARPIDYGWQGVAAASTSMNIPIMFGVPMRATPTIYGGSGTISIYGGAGFSTTAMPTIAAGSSNSCYLSLAGFTGLTIGSPYLIVGIPATLPLFVARL